MPRSPRPKPSGSSSSPRSSIRWPAAAAPSALSPASTGTNTTTGPTTASAAAHCFLARKQNLIREPDGRASSPPPTARTSANTPTPAMAWLAPRRVAPAAMRCSLLAQVCLSDKDLLCFPYPPDSNRAGCCLKSCVRIPFTIVCARKYRKSILEFDATDNSEKGPDRLQGTRARRISPRRTTVRFAAQIQTKSDTVIENSLYSTPLRALAQNSRTLFQATRSHLVST